MIDRTLGDAPTRGARRILIVHPDAGAAGELRARLVGLGYQVVGVASSPVDATGDTPADPRPELVLWLIVEAGDAGELATAHASLRELALPVVLIGSQEAEERARRAGLDGPHAFVVEPTRDRDLRAHLDLALCRGEGPRAIREMEGFFAVSRDMFCFLGFDGFFRRLNLAWERTLGFTRQELMSRPFIEFVHPDDRERTLRQNARVRAGGEASSFENRYMCKDGSHRWFLWNAVPAPEDRIIYSVARDITERKRLEAERGELVQRLEQSLAEVRTLQEILPICSYCRRIRDDRDYWLTVESYIAQHTSSRFSHGICPTCLASEVEPHL